MNVTAYSQTAITVLAIILCLVVLTIALTLPKYLDGKYTDLVCQNSARYKALEWLNSSYDFHETLKPVYSYYWDVDSKPKFDRFDFWKNLKDRISTRPEQFKHLLYNISENQALYKKYCEDINKLTDYTPKGSDFLEGKSYRRYSRIEKAMCEAEILHPVTDVVFHCSLTYTSPAGRNSYNDDCEFTPGDVQNMLNEIDDYEKKRASAEYQRSLMSQSMRYDVMKRDGFRCVLCGRTADDGIKLQVDHIIPVSKGGKTRLSNLRTLCEDCNHGKRDKYDEDGLN